MYSLKKLSLVSSILALATIFVSFRVFARTSKVLSLDSDSAYLEVPHIDFTNIFTVEAWVYCSDYEDVNIISQMDMREMKHNASFRRNKHLHMGIRNGKPYINFGDSVLTAKTVLNRGRWNHVAFQHTATEQRIYINGFLDNFFSASHYEGKTGKTFIGGGAHGSSGNSLIDEVRIWSVARTQEQIQATKDTELTGDEDGLVAYWNFDDGTVNDLSHGHNDVKINGNVELTDQYRVLFAPQKRSRLDNRFFLTGLAGWAISTENVEDNIVSAYSLNLGYKVTPKVSCCVSIERISPFEIAMPEEGVFKGMGLERAEVKEEEGKVDSLGDIKMLGFLGSIRYRVFSCRVFKKEILSWIYGGVGQYHGEFSNSDELNQAWQSLSNAVLEKIILENNNMSEDDFVEKSIWTTSDVNSLLGYHFGVHLDIPITENIFLYGDGKYSSLITRLKITFNLDTKIKDFHFWNEETDRTTNKVRMLLAPVRLSMDKDLKLDSAVFMGGLKIVF